MVMLTPDSAELLLVSSCFGGGFLVQSQITFRGAPPLLLQDGLVQITFGGALPPIGWLRLGSGLDSNLLLQESQPQPNLRPTVTLEAAESKRELIKFHHRRPDFCPGNSFKEWSNEKKKSRALKPQKQKQKKHSFFFSPPTHPPAREERSGTVCEPASKPSSLRRASCGFGAELPWRRCPCSAAFGCC